MRWLCGWICVRVQMKLRAGAGDLRVDSRTGCDESAATGQTVPRTGCDEPAATGQTVPQTGCDEPAATGQTVPRTGCGVQMCGGQMCKKHFAFQCGKQYVTPFRKQHGAPFRNRQAHTAAPLRCARRNVPWDTFCSGFLRGIQKPSESARIRDENGSAFAANQAP